MIKKICEKVKLYLIGILSILIPVGISILIFWIAYEIATSDLPDWFKFWLLK